MTTFDRFTDQDWQLAETRLAEGENWDVETFKQWLAWDETQAKLASLHGAEWTMEQALDLALGKTQQPERARKIHGKPKPSAAGRGVGDRSNGLRPLRSLEPDRPTAPSLSDEPIETRDTRNEHAAPIDHAEYDALFAATLAKYLDSYVDRTPNDDAALRMMVNAQVTIALLEKLRTQVLLDENVDSARVARFTHSIAEETKKFNELQAQLGIGRAQREKKQESASDADKVLQSLDDAGKWIEEQSIEVKHCGIMLGLLVTQFKEKEWRVSVVCPRCNELVSIQHVPTAEDLRANEPGWVAVEETEYRKRELAKQLSDAEDALTEGEEAV
jgi:hypothetical protein